MTCEALEEVLTIFMYLVSAVHQPVGTIGAEVEDPCFAPWGWREGDLCGPPRSFFTQSAIMVRSHESIAHTHPRPSCRASRNALCPHTLPGLGGAHAYPPAQKEATIINVRLR